MTAEIVVMNKFAVAMAADSVVSVGDQKEYRSAMKLFALRPDLPVGIMIYNSAEFASTPWEVIIKEYRTWAPAEALSTLQEYAAHFLNFLAENQAVFPPAVRERSVRQEIGAYFTLSIREPLKELVQSALSAGQTPTDTWVETQFDALLTSALGDLASTPELEFVNPDYAQEVADLIDTHAVPIMEETFQALLSDDRRAVLKEIARLLLMHDCSRRHYAGIVIAGYGADEMFPAAREFVVHIATPKNVTYAEDAERQSQVSPTNGSVIMPCAQRRTVDAFVTGLDPKLAGEIIRGMGTLLDEFADTVVDRVADSFTPQAADAPEALRSDLDAAADALVEGFLKALKERSRAFWSQPMIDAVSVLPKDELANMAESLVNITSLRQRVSLSRETVGGPIDVCVISRSEGLVWISRKHYFPADLNPQFMARYVPPVTAKPEEAQ